MARTKLELAIQYLNLIGDETTKPEEFASINTIRRLHHLIEVEEEKTPAPAPELPVVVEKKKIRIPKPLWAFVSLDDDEEFE